MYDNELKHMGKSTLRKDGAILVELGSGSAYLCLQIRGVEMKYLKTFTY